MKCKYLLSAFVCLLSAFVGNAAIDFEKNSRLATGKWVKVQVKDRGVYSIPYDQLREMGFAEPQKVGVYGKGGSMLDVNFVSSNGDVIYEDDVRPVSVVHANDRLMFYVEGVEKMRWNINENRYVKVSKNLYSDSGIYFLSDCADPISAKESALTGGEAVKMNGGMDYLYHEKDLFHNDTRTGQIFWGESFLENGGQLKFNVPATHATNGDALLEYSFYLEPNSSAKVPYTSYMAIAESNDEYRESKNKAKTSKYVATSLCNEFSVRPKGEFNITLSAACSTSSFIHLDYWLLTYPKRFPSERNSISATEHYLFPDAKNKRYILNVPQGLSVWNVTDPKNPVICLSDPNDAATGLSENIIVESTGDYVLLAIVDPDSNNLQSIEKWSEVDNQNLHALSDKKVEFVIATVPEFKEYADEIAELHRNYDNTNAVVVTTEQLYNEFSGGVPDPMAYRAFMKMLYDGGDGCLKNLLLLGPSLSDFRNTDCPQTPYNIHIAYQEPDLTLENEGAAVYDFYGMLADNLNASSLYKETMHAGVGVLSCNNGAECRLAIRKIRSYLENRREHAWRMNDFLTLGGEGDVHTHDWQAENYAQTIRNFPPAPYAVSNVSIDALGYETARKNFISKLDEGKLCLIYYGHGDGRMIGPDIQFFSTSHVLSLNNTHKGFMFLGGCHFTAPYRGSRGLGEDLVLSTEGGMMGGIVSTRASLSSKNYELSQKFAKSWLDAGWDTFPTMGEIYANTKSKSESNNSLSYLYSGDPALKVPVATRIIDSSVKTSLMPGGVLRIKGSILGVDGKPDAQFNGNCVIKVMKPDVTITSKDYVTNTCSASNANERDTLRVKYMAERLLAMESAVKNGEFDVEIPFSQEYGKYVGKELGVYLSAVDTESLIGAVGRIYVPVDAIGESGVPAEDRDDEAPMLTVWYDSPNSLLHIEASDNRGMIESPELLKVKVDGADVAVSSLNTGNRASIANRYEAVTDMDDLTPGKHVAYVECVDMSGNIRKLEYDFEKIRNNESLNLALSSRAVVDSLTIDIEGAEGEEVELKIVDSLGNNVLERNVSGASFDWDCKDAKGVLLNPGLYRLMACTSASGTLPKYSKWETIAILQ